MESFESELGLRDWLPYMFQSVRSNILLSFSLARVIEQ